MMIRPMDFFNIKQWYNALLDSIAKKTPCYKKLEKEKGDLESRLTSAQNEKELSDDIIDFYKTRLRDLQDTLEFAVVEIDNEGIIKSTNSLADKLLGYERKDIVKKPMKDFCSGNEDIKCLMIIPTLADLKYDNTYRPINLKTKTGVRELGMKIQILYDGEKDNFIGAELYLQKIGLFKKALEKTKRIKSYNKIAPEVMDGKYKQKEVKEIIHYLLDRKDIHINMAETKEVKEDVLDLLVNLSKSSIKDKEKGVYLDNVSTPIYNKFIENGFPEDCMSEKKLL